MVSMTRPSSSVGVPPLGLGVGEVAAQRGVLGLEVGRDERLLAGEVAVHRGAGDAGLLEDAVDADAVDALAVEEPGRGGEEALAAGGPRRRRLVHVATLTQAQTGCVGPVAEGETSGPASGATGGNGYCRTIVLPAGPARSLTARENP